VTDKPLGRKLGRVEITVKKQLLYSTKVSKGWFKRGQSTGKARLEIFRIKVYFDFRFRVRQFPFNPGHLTSVSASKSRDTNIFPFKTNSV